MMKSRGFGSTSQDGGAGGVYLGDDPSLLLHLRRTVKQIIEENPHIPLKNSSGTRTRDVKDFTSIYFLHFLLHFNSVC